MLARVVKRLSWCEMLVSKQPYMLEELTERYPFLTDTFMKKVLCVLSDLDAAHFSPMSIIPSLLFLKSQGMTQIDITSDPRLHSPESHKSHARPVTDFDKVARQFCREFLCPVIGQSELIDLSRALSRANTPPDLSSLSHVGRLFTKATSHELPQDMAVKDGSTLGLAFYLAQHARQYDTLLCPDLTRSGQKVLSGFTGVIGDILAPYGRIIHLSPLRHYMMKFKGDNIATPRNETNVAPRRYLAS